MAAISAGEFERIFKEFYKPLCLFALRFTEKTEDAEDVVQQVFADVWDKNSHDMVIANFKSYLYQAVRNRSLTLIAQSSDMLQTTECIADIEDLSEEEQIYQSERDARLWAAIDGLPAERKKIFLLSKRDGLKYQISGLSDRKVKCLCITNTKKKNEEIRVICDVDDECGIGERTTVVVDAGSRDDGRQERRLFLYR
mgnify:CR=1 FL=1